MRQTGAAEAATAQYKTSPASLATQTRDYIQEYFYLSQFDYDNFDLRLKSYNCRPVAVLLVFILEGTGSPPFDDNTYTDYLTTVVELGWELWKAAPSPGSPGGPSYSIANRVCVFVGWSKTRSGAGRAQRSYTAPQ